MEIVLTLTINASRDISGDRMDQDILRIVFAFVCEGVLD